MMLPTIKNYSSNSSVINFRYYSSVSSAYISWYQSDATKLATDKLTWENVWEYEEINSLEVIFVPPFSKEIKNPVAFMISRMRIAEYLDEYHLNSTNEEELRKQFLDYNERMKKYYENESEELDDYDDDNSFDFGEPYYETD